MAGINIPATTLKTFFQWIQAIGYTLGPAIITYNLAHFQVSKSGYYFVNYHKYGLTIGVLMLAIAMYMRRNNK
ncbi:MAG: hypothetical protein OEZ10_05565 [Gammaproteobacteria bacterium]|nr:hypothetical protein [Gammaproteobacteria bacterium]